MALEPQKKSPQEKPQAAPEAVTKSPAPLARPAAASSPRRRSDGSRIPGEAYTPMPDFSEPRPGRWRILAAAAALALALTMGYLKFHPRASASGPAASQTVGARAAQPDLRPLYGAGK
jgi:hypothetical protein